VARTQDLSLDDFALFGRVAELRNLSAVAREREVPASMVSRALSRIEKLCGARLVHRTTHGLSLTDEGETLAAHGLRVLEAAQALDADLDERQRVASGLVRVATSPVMALVLLPALEPLLQQHPQLRVEIAAEDRMVDLAREGIDIAIRSGTPTGLGLVARLIGDHGRAIYASPEYLARHGTPATPDDLQQPGHRLIGNSASPAMNRWPFVVDGQALDMKVSGTLRTDNTAIALAMALQGLGIARVTRSSALPHVEAGRLVAVLPRQVDLQPVPIYAVMPQDRQRLPKVRVCVEHFAACFGRAALQRPQAQRPAQRSRRT
jgi:DNA-binding transcriptional LysR family regulator